MPDEELQTIFIPFTYLAPGSATGSSIKLKDTLFDRVINLGIPQRVHDYRSVDGALEDLIGSKMRALAVVPLKARGRTIGLIWVARAASKPAFTEYDLVLLESISGQSAIALDNIELFEQQRFISESLQRGFLPRGLPELAQTEIGIFYTSATTAAIVGGDFYDAIKLADGKIALFVGDVSGKGVSATSEAAMGKYSLRALASENPEPAHILKALNEIATQQLRNGHFITLVYSLYDATSGLITLGVAGHPFPLFYTAATGSVSPLVGDNPALAIIPGYEFDVAKIRIAEGDILFFYTDGVLELRRNSDFLGIERLGELLAGYANLPAQEIVDSIIDDAREFARGRLTDDIVLMVIKRAGT